MSRIQRSHHYDTPHRCKIKGVFEYFAKTNRVLSQNEKHEIFRVMDASKTSGYEILNGSDRTRHNDSARPNETRGRNPIITGAQVAEADKILEEAENAEDKSFTWETLGVEINTEACPQTVQQTLQTNLQYHKRLPPVKEYVTSRVAEMRLKFCHDMLALRPESKDWRNVRFSDEHHDGFGSIGRVWIIRKSDRARRIASNNVQRRDSQSSQKDKNRLHVWAAVGYNFKSELFFYEIPSNKNGKMTLQGYIEILERFNGVKDWLERDEDFVLEEDRDGGHGTDATNIVRTWKQQHRLPYYFNVFESPDLSVIENVFQSLKKATRKQAVWDVATLKTEMIRAWEETPQKWINSLVDSMPQRLHDVIRAEGAITGW